MRPSSERIEEIRKDMKNVTPDCEQAEYVAELLTEVDALRADLECRGVHTCHSECQNPFCVTARERDALKAENEKLKIDYTWLREYQENHVQKLKSRISALRQVIDTSESTLDDIKYELNASEYTLDDDEFGLVFYVRDILQAALAQDEQEHPQLDPDVAKHISKMLKREEGGGT